MRPLLGNPLAASCRRSSASSGRGRQHGRAVFGKPVFGAGFLQLLHYGAGVFGGQPCVERAEVSLVPPLGKSEQRGGHQHRGRAAMLSFCASERRARSFFICSMAGSRYTCICMTA